VFARASGEGCRARQRPHPLTVGKFDPDRRVIAGLLPAAHMSIDLRAEEPLRERLAEKEVIDPQPGIARECIPEIIEEGIDCLGGVDRAQRIGPALLG